MNRITPSKCTQALAAPVEGNSTCATVRMTGVSNNAIRRLLTALGPACEEYQSRALRNFRCKCVQCEAWSFCYAKQENVRKEKQGQFGYGDVWTWTAFRADTKLICSWKVGTRGATAAYALIHDLGSRVAKRIQLTARHISTSFVERKNLTMRELVDLLTNSRAEAA